MAKKWASDGVRVNVVSPGMIPTGIMEAAGLSPETAREQFALGRSMQPLPREGSAMDVAEAVVHFASAPSVTGAVLHVDGGLSLGG